MKIYFLKKAIKIIHNVRIEIKKTVLAISNQNEKTRISRKEWNEMKVRKYDF